MNRHHHSPRCTLVLRLSAILFGLLALSSAQAITFCANSVALLNAALSVAQFSSDANTIKIVQGTYLMDADMVYTFASPTTIEGGYTLNCAARVVNPANTVINIGQGHPLTFKQLSASPQAQINVDGLTFSNSDLGLLFKAGQFHPIGANDEGSVNLSRVRFTQLSEGFSGPALMIFATNGAIHLDNVLIDHVSTPGDCAVEIFSDGGAAVNINHMSAELSNGSDFCFDDGEGVSSDAAPISVYNSILWNDGAGQAIFRGGSNAASSYHFVNDLFADWSIIGAVNVQNQINAAPGFIDPANGNYRLLGNPLSPAINSGSFFNPSGEPDTDIEGHARVIGSFPDRGAYESLISDQTTLIVSNTLDSGIGSLRDAITSANANPSPPKVIAFDIRGAGNTPICPAVIALSSLLPTITGKMTIDGYTQPTSVKNTDPNNFNAKLCVMLKPTSGTLGAAFTVPADSFGSLSLRGLGIGGFGQPVRILGGQSSLIAGNQFGGTANGVALPGAGLNAITIGASASGTLVVGGINAADRNVIGGAGFSGIANQSNALGAFTSCQIVNNLIGLAPSGVGQLANNFGINNTGSGCQIVGNRIAGNTITNLWLNNSNGNVVQQNKIGFNTLGEGFFNDAIGILVTGSNNLIGAGGNGGAITANTVRLMHNGGVVVRGGANTGNSIRANRIYDNGPNGIGDGMDIDLQVTDLATGPNANDAGDADLGPNQLQNFPVPTVLAYTGPGTGPGQLNRPANLTVTLDTQPGAHRVDVYYASAANAQRGHAEVFLANQNVNITGVPVTFTVPIIVPNQLPGGVISLTATDANGNTSEIGTALSITPPFLFADGLETVF